MAEFRSKADLILLAISHLLAWSLLLVWCDALRADGGTLRVSEQTERYQITIFTSPTPLRAGWIDVSILVQDSATLAPLSDARVTVRAAPHGRPELAVSYPATNQAATNKLFQVANFQILEPGGWDIVARVGEDSHSAEVSCEVEVGPAMPRWYSLWPWIAWPAVVVALFGVHQWLVRHKRATPRFS